MDRQELHFRVLQPDQPLPAGIGFVDSPLKAVEAVLSRKLLAAIWRSPQMNEILPACRAANFTQGMKYNKTSSYSGYRDVPAREEDFPCDLPIADLNAKTQMLKLFAEVACAVERRSGPNSNIQRVFKIDYAGAADDVHFDDFLRATAAQIQALICLKGQGTWMMSPSELKKAGQPRRGWTIERYPSELVYEAATGDWVFWSGSFPHSGPTVRSGNERLVGIIRPVPLL